MLSSCVYTFRALWFFFFCRRDFLLSTRLSSDSYWFWNFQSSSITFKSLKMPVSTFEPKKWVVSAVTNGVCHWHSSPHKTFQLQFWFNNCVSSFKAYHSSISRVDDHLANFALLPLRTQTRGPAPITNGEDIIDESLYFFKANIFFRTYEIKVSPLNRKWLKKWISNFCFDFLV